MDSKILEYDFDRRFAIQCNRHEIITNVYGFYKLNRVANFILTISSKKHLNLLILEIDTNEKGTLLPFMRWICLQTVRISFVRILTDTYRNTFYKCWCWYRAYTCDLPLSILLCFDFSIDCQLSWLLRLVYSNNYSNKATSLNPLSVLKKLCKNL